MALTKEEILEKLNKAFDAAFKREDFDTCRKICDSMYYIFIN